MQSPKVIKKLEYGISQALSKLIISYSAFKMLYKFKLRSVIWKIKNFSAIKWAVK